MNGGVWATLAAQLDLAALSFPGHGATDGPPLASIESMAQWVSRQLDARAEKSVVLMGHSMGALVALAAAHHHAVTGLILIGAAARMPVHADLLKQAEETPAAAAELILKWGVAKANVVAVELLRPHMQPATLFNDLSACNNYEGADMPAKPALVLAGEDDKLTRADDSAALAQKLGATLRRIAAAGHMLMVEKPAEIASEIKAFMKERGG